MSNNYKETTITGTKWTRAAKVVLNNPYLGIPTIMFEEEEIISAGGTVIRQDAQRMLGNDVQRGLTDPTTAFPLLDPATDAVIGTATHGQVYALIYSLYKQLAIERDAYLATPTV